jgi:hypothetical protein
MDVVELPLAQLIPYARNPRNCRGRCWWSRYRGGGRRFVG